MRLVVGGLQLGYPWGSRGPVMGITTGRAPPSNEPGHNTSRRSSVTEVDSASPFCLSVLALGASPRSATVHIDAA